jgi:hypothetical protein
LRSKYYANAIAGIIILFSIAAYARYSVRENPSKPTPATSPSIPKKSASKPSSTNKAVAAIRTPGPEAVVVKLLPDPINASVTKTEMLLFDAFANNPDEEKFSSYTTAGWETNFTAFAAALVEKAEKQGLEAVPLRAVPDLILKDAHRLAYLPVGAYQAIFNDKPVWIVTVKWESTSFGETLSHIRIYVFDRQTLKRVAFVTCD